MSNENIKDKIGCFILVDLYNAFFCWVIGCMIYIVEFKYNWYLKVGFLLETHFTNKRKNYIML